MKLTTTTKTTTAGDVVLNDLWKWQDGTGWVKCSTLNGPGARGSTCLVQLPHPHQQWLFLFGGFTGKKCLNDSWLYNTASDEWKSLGVIGGAPNERAGYGCVLVGNKLLFIGGFETAGGCVADSYILHIG